MSKVEHSDTYVRETDSRIKHREFLLQGVEKLTLLHDTFMKVALKDVEACQHVIRILMDDPTIEIVEVRSQYRISKLVSKDAVLDILAEDTQGRGYNLDPEEDDHRPCPAYPAVQRPGGCGVPGKGERIQRDAGGVCDLYQ